MNESSDLAMILYKKNIKCLFDW